MTDPHIAVGIDAERKVLGAMLLGAVEEASQHLIPADFYEHRHGLLYDHMLEMWAAGELVNPTLLTARLLNRGELKNSGTAVYLNELAAGAALPGQIGFYARIILAEAKRRTVSVLAAQLEAAARIDDADVREAKVTGLLQSAIASAEAPERDSWSPVDLGPYLDGTHERPEPSVGLARKDGLRLLYPGKEHAVIGEMESGKSWFSLACVAAEIGSGSHVVYIHFEESDPTDTVERLQALGCTRAQIREGFLFVGPARPATPERISRLLAYEPTLVVLDGQNEGMALHAQAIREEDGVAAFRQLMVKPWTAAGAAVLACDHVVKDKESRGRYALGSVHKGNALDGSLIVLENAEPFGRGERGASRVYVTKDRPGHLRRHGQAKRDAPGKTYMGQLVVDDTRRWIDALELVFWPPSDDVPEGDKPKSPLGDWVLEAVAAQPEQTVGSDRMLFALLRKRGIQVRDSQVREALDDLVVADRIELVPGPRNAKGYRITTASPEQPELPL